MSDSLQQQLQQFELPTRTDFPWVTAAITGIGVVLSLLHIWFNTLSTLPELWISATHFAGFALICLLWYPAHASLKRSRIALAVDVLIGIAALACLIYIPFAEDALYQRGVKFVASDWVVSITAILIAIEIIRRTMGWFIPVLIVICLSYVVWWGKWAGGIFHFPGLSMETLLYRSFFSSEGMFGSISRISWTFVFMFILFGAFLVKSGVGDYIINVSRAAAGKIIGGPGFIAVLGSGLMGSVSGSSVANTVSTGVISIPLMQKAGFPSRFAAGVEAAASTGGQLMPPVMGAGAFIMASYTQIPYVDIVAVSFVPALIYFLSVAFFVRIEAKRSGVQKITTSDESLGKVLLSGWHNLIPLAVLVTLLVQGFTPTYAAGLSILSVVVASWFLERPQNGAQRDHRCTCPRGKEHGDDCGLAGGHWLGDQRDQHHRDWQYLLIDDQRLVEGRFVDHASADCIGFTGVGHGPASYRGLHRVGHALCPSLVSIDCGKPAVEPDVGGAIARTSESNFYARSTR